MKFFHDLADIVPPITGWHIRVKILRLFSVILDHPSKRLGLVLSNKDGVRIEAYVDKTMANYYDQFIEEGKWYTITKFGLINNLGGFRATSHHFKMYFLQDTVVKKTPSVNGNIVNHFAPSVNGCILSPFVEFKNIIDGTIDDSYLVDLVGAIFDVGTLHNIANNRTDLDGFEIPFKLKDNNGRVIACMAVKKEALEFDRNYRNYRMHGGGGTIVVVLRWWKFCRNCDGPQNVKICTHGPISKVSYNENIPEVNDIRETLGRTDIVNLAQA